MLKIKTNSPTVDRLSVLNFDTISRPAFN